MRSAQIVRCTLLVGLIVSSRSELTMAFCVASAKPLHGSTTQYCYESPIDSGKFVIEVSVATLIELARQEGAPLAQATIKNVLTVMRRHHVQAAGIRYNHNATSAGQTQECTLYAMEDRGLLDEQAVLLHRFTDDCRLDAVHFAWRVSTAIDDTPESQMSLRAFYSRSAEVSGVTLRMMYHGSVGRRRPYPLSALIASVLDLQGHVVESLAYPVVVYQVEPGDTLSEIAEDHDLSASDWPVLLSLNPGSVSHPRGLVAGSQIFVPARIESWQPVDTSGESAVTLSKRQYGTERLGGLIEELCSGSPSSSPTCYLPEFAGTDRFQDVATGRAGGPWRGTPPP